MLSRKYRNTNFNPAPQDDPPTKNDSIIHEVFAKYETLRRMENVYRHIDEIISSLLEVFNTVLEMFSPEPIPGAEND